ncbi:hypothetical protein PBY51_011829 [Eleginops maclovinus]|uniref:Uncharacterized protein n=1 Tax=Eleginops maclovinus TaxID=56733 RepID=A0AAN8ALR0_ELEMC|nr:hypothetical protein PBY51_011829 [Eleginops maclovinus]
MARQVAICCEKTDKKHSISWFAEDSVAPVERQPGTETARGIGHKCYHPASSEYNSISIIKVSILFALSGLNHAQSPHLLVVDKQVWVE